MKAKAANVVRTLGLSKATVSFAVNGKPGVSEETRQKILRCIEEIETNNGMIPPEDIQKQDRPVQFVKIVFVNHKKQVISDLGLNLWSDILNIFDREIHCKGYLYGITYLDETDDNIQGIIDECNLDMVAGIILYGPQICPENNTQASSNICPCEAGIHHPISYEIVHRIHKPLVIYGHEMPDGSRSSICRDSVKAVEIAMEVLRESGASEIRYLSTGKDICTFVQQRKTFQNIQIGTKKIPDTLKIMGIGEVPENIIPDVRFPQICIDHAKCAAMLMDLQDREIGGFWNTKVKVSVMPELLYR